MIVLDSFKVFILVSSMSAVLSEGPAAAPSPNSNGLGKSACILYGNIVKGECELETLLCDHLPPECTSYVYMFISTDVNYNIYNSKGPQANVYLKKLLECAKQPVYIGYGYDSVMEWSSVLACNGADGINFVDEIESLKTFFSLYTPIAGLLIKNLDIVPGQASFENFSPFFKSYLTALKDNIRGLKIGVYVFADQLAIHLKNPVVQWLDFKELNDVLDHVVISYDYFFHPCVPDLLHTGVFPIKGNQEFTMEIVQAYVNKAGITKEKLHFRLETYPVSDQNPDASFCAVSYPLMCKDPKASSKWCSDTIATFYEKGVYTKNNAFGFLAAYVDTDDVNCVCQCSQKFPAFYAILNGLNGAPIPAPCPLIDRN